MNELVQNLIKMENHHSLFEDFIKNLSVPVVETFLNKGKINPISFKKSDHILNTKDQSAVAEAFPQSIALSENKILVADSFINVENLRVAVLFSGGPASGGHNIVVGIKKALGEKNTLLGVKAGPKGLLAGDFFELTDELVLQVVNTGGFDLLGSDRTKIKTEEQFEKVKEVVNHYQLDAIIIVGGDDSNTNAAILAEILAPQKVAVIGVPKTIDGDLQLGDLLPISFGFDTATKIYSEMVGNILQDTASSLKYWHFVKIMGRAASHVALETALQTKPAYTIISEEIKEKNKSLQTVVNEIAEVIIKRAGKGINHGLVLIPEGFIEFIPEMRVLLSEMDHTIGHNVDDFSRMDKSQKYQFIIASLNQENISLYKSLPPNIQEMLLLDRDSHGNLPLSQIPTEMLVIEMVSRRISEQKKIIPHLESFKFNTMNHFFGYEGRCGAPTLFDAAYCLNLGLVAGSLALSKYTGYMAALTDLQHGGRIQALPLTGLLNIESRHGKDEFVIEKALVKLDSQAFLFFAERRNIWAESDVFCSPGPRQLLGITAKQVPISVALNSGYSDLSFNLGQDIQLN
ncbi:pyrophosphate--fructose-6-phosphate 1-phosphotransferase [Brevinema andersonii]|uniref:Pyrophosphate--fructose-6-phosphate 1-phosphotransferase n=1 Tax=Brevinema andersonii TaxID=34097 RepID=A0A1I1EAD6_BREAD|nr:diphosphate--fructose-6-phosphate 1-phosphotransferase [Brevinema andersonii]SFB84084.1 pyrophosphate--fructose-6-phosphate 1-phosphotransferase [Brevinema andersonii]